jgi:dienelactone hydrolase
MSVLWSPEISEDDDLHKVMIKRDTLIDQSRDGRAIKIKVYYPVLNNASGAQARNGQTKYPVILWSHGLGGSVDGAAFLSRYIASYGYIIVHAQHHGTDSSLWEGKDGHPWDIIRDTKIPRSATLDRYRDIPFVLDHFQDWLLEHPEIKDIADFSTVGMSGHSFGALTTQVMAGMPFPDHDGNLISFKDDRFTAGILYSPGSVEHLGDLDWEEVYSKIDLPLFHMTGTDDGSPISDLGYEIRLAVYEHTHKAEKHILIIKDGDHMVFNGSRGKLGQNPNRDKHERIIKVSALAYWDMKLKNDQSAREWLTGEGYQNWLGDEGAFK